MKAIIFDCDGTLVDSEELGCQVLVSCLAELGLRISHEAVLSLFRGAKLAELLRELETRHEVTLPETFVPEFRARLATEFRQRLRPIAGARELLEAMTLPFCVASSGPRDKIELSLSLTGLRHFFGDRVFSSYEIGTWKPDPGLFLHAAAALNVAPADCGVVEDSPVGVQAGVAAGMTVFALQLDGASFDVPPGVRRIGALAELAPLFAPARAF